jgi:hypothetical protein
MIKTGPPRRAQVLQQALSLIFKVSGSAADRILVLLRRFAVT